MIKRYEVAPLPELVALQDATFQHLVRARRLPSGAQLHLVDGRGGRARGRLEVLGRRSAQIVDLHLLAREEEPAPLTVWVAQPKLERASWVVEKLTELAVREIVFWHADRSQHSYPPGRIERLRRVAVAALEQSGGACLPRLAFDRGAEDLEERLQPGVGSASRRTAIALDKVEDQVGPRPVPAEIRGALRSGPVHLLVGPEGGWSDAERSLFRERGWPSWCVGPRFLRVETAAVVGAGVLLEAWWRRRDEE